MTRGTQVGGTHYKTFSIEPVDYITQNKLDWYQGNIVKYVSRHKLKNGVDDIKKVIHYAQMLLEDNYNIVSRVSYTDRGKNCGKQPAATVSAVCAAPDTEEDNQS